MAKTFGNLWPQLVSWDNLLLAYRKCRRRKRYQPVATNFDFAWEENLFRLQQDLIDGTYVHGPYRHFHISEPKPRKISAAPFPDRIVHHAVVNVLEPIFERRFIHDSYACRKGKGTHQAIDRAQSFLRRYQWSLKTDIVKFFPNIDHALLLGAVGNVISDQRVLGLLNHIVDSGAGVLADEASNSYFPGDDLFSVQRPRGVPIGNLTSQFLANVFLDQLDHVAKEVLRVPGYVRYADDIVVFANSKQELWRLRSLIEAHLATLRLKLHPNKTHVAPTSQGIRFLGFHIRRYDRRPLQSSLRRFVKRCRRQKFQRQHGKMDYRRISASLRCWLAHIGPENAVARDLLRRIRF